MKFKPGDTIYYWFGGAPATATVRSTEFASLEDFARYTVLTQFGTTIKLLGCDCYSYRENAFIGRMDNLISIKEELEDQISEVDEDIRALQELMTKEGI